MTSVTGERLQKVLAQLGLGSRREAEAWIRAGRLTVNGRPAVLGMRVGSQDQVKLDGRTVRRTLAAAAAPVFLCHRSPGEPLLPARGAAATAEAVAVSIAERLPRRAGRRFISISPMPNVDGGLELLTADGAIAERLQRAVHAMEAEFSLRVRGELSETQQQAIRDGALDSGARVQVLDLEANGGEGSNRWYRLLAQGASGNQIRQLLERQAVTLARVLRTRLGTLELPRTLARSHWQQLTTEQLDSLTHAPRA
ncbi:MAG TPA: S4 domain-containing protein [Steroidobacteraceae bacterium]|jgi:23S rRNA pseudouridine2605 synthase|nr:S4 domain-containing protein [Steroidobacteraceae bacterium]